MRSHIKYSSMFKNIFLASLTTLVTVSLTQSLQASTENTEINRLQEIQFVPPEGGEEPDTKGAGTRNPLSNRCQHDEPAMEIIMPEGNYGLTTQAKPKIYLYLPNSSAKQVVLSFRSQDSEEPEVAFVAIDSEQAVNSFALPETSPDLEVGQSYQWQLTVVCGKIPHVNDPIFTGWVKRVPLSLSNQVISQQPPLQQAQWYAANGYWYDLLQQVEEAANNTSEAEINSVLWLQLIDRF